MGFFSGVFHVGILKGFQKIPAGGVTTCLYFGNDPPKKKVKQYMPDGINFEVRQSGILGISSRDLWSMYIYCKYKHAAKCTPMYEAEKFYLAVTAGLRGSVTAKKGKKTM